MKNTILYILLRSFILACFVLSTVSCKKETKAEWPKGALEGRALLYTVSTPMDDCSGIKVTVEGSSPLSETITDENGRFTIENLETGIYDIAFSKEGFGTYKMISVQFTGGNIPYYLDDVSLYKVPDVGNPVITLVEEAVNIAISKPRPAEFDGFQYYLSNDPDVSYINYQTSGILTVSTGTTPGNYRVHLPSFNTSGFAVGNRIYIIVYPRTISTLQYINLNTGNYIFPNINTNQPSNIISFTKK